MEQFLSNVITDEDLARIQLGAFNILRAPRGWGKTTFMFDEKILNFARAKKHILYLIHNKQTRDFIALNHKDCARVFTDKDASGWFAHRKKGIYTVEADEDFIQVMCYQTFAALLRHEGTDWLEDIDLIVWDEFDDIKKYYEKEIVQLKKALPDFSRERLVALLQEGKTTSVVNFVYQIQTVILEPARIRLLALSATPENAALYFRDYINYILQGQLEEKFAALHTIYIESIIQAIKTGLIQPGKKYWCFTPYVHSAFRLEQMFRSIGCNTIVVWSEHNSNWQHLMTQERKDALAMIMKEGRAPEQYDVVITTAVNERGLNIFDTSFQDWICDSDEYEYLGQFLRARFCPENQYLPESARGVVEFVQNGFAIDYYQWHSLDELEILLQDKPICSNDAKKKRLTNFNAVKKEYPDLFESRRYGAKHKIQYRIKPAE